MITEPMFLSVPSLRDYEKRRLEAKRVEGWNEAMEYIFGQEIHATRKKARCWLMKNYGDWLCKTCQNREVCAKAFDESILQYVESEVEE